MNIRTVKKSGTLAGALALVLGGLLVVPSPAAASCPSLSGPAPNGSVVGVLTEVLESPPAHAAPGGSMLPGAFPPGIGGRLAEATEVGTFSQGCGTLSGFVGNVEFHGQSRIAINASGQLDSGPISAVFQIRNGSKGAIVGKLDGTLDFSPTTSTSGGCPCPFVNIFGSWSTLGKNRTNGTFMGFALIPVEVSPGTFAYFDPTGFLAGTPGFVSLGPDDFSEQFATALAKFVFTLSQ